MELFKCRKKSEHQMNFLEASVLLFMVSFGAIPVEFLLE